MKAEYTIAKIISYVFHPLLLPTFGLLIIFNLSGLELFVPMREGRLFIIGLIAVTTFLLPVANAFFLLKTKQIYSLEMKTREERKIPFLVSAIFYSVALYILMKAEVSLLVRVWMLGATALVVLVLLINIIWKISVHMVAIGGLFGMMIALSERLQLNINYLLITLALVAGLIGFARLKLDAHNPAQVYVGFLLGVVVELAFFL